MVEARGVEPLSEDRQRTVSTCVADSLVSQPPTPIGRLRTAASPESSRPQPLSTSLGPARCIAPRPPPRASGGETSRLKPRVPVLDWQLHFPGGLTSPQELDMLRWLQYPRRYRSPPFSENVEKPTQRRSRVRASLRRTDKEYASVAAHPAGLAGWLFEHSLNAPSGLAGTHFAHPARSQPVP